MVKMAFSEYIKFLENKGIYLLEYQKILLKKMIEEKHDFSVPISMPIRHCNYSMVMILFMIYLEMFNEIKGEE